MAGSIENMEGFYEDSDDMDEDNTGEEDKLNGSIVKPAVVDRYGFMGGTQYTNPDTEFRLPIEIVRKRELKWLDMLENWERWMSKRFKKVKLRCRKGIPPSLRARAWQYMCGSKFFMERHRGKYHEYLRQRADPKWVDEITRDLHRQFPLHEMFAARGGHGQEDLYNVLIAYTNHNPKEGYCQAQGPVAAVLIMHMPAEQAFWCLVSICEKYMPGYYSIGLEAVQIDGDVLFGLLKKVLPATYKHLKAQNVEPILYMTEWFMCLFVRTLPWACVLRMWDIFLCEGVKVLFRIALVLFKLTLSSPDVIKECPTMYEIIERLKHIPVEQLNEDTIVRESLRLPINERDMEREHRKQLDKRRAVAKAESRHDRKQASKKSKR